MEKENQGKMNLTTKILTGIVVIGTLFYTGCESYKTSNETYSRPPFKQHNYPNYMKILDPFNPKNTVSPARVLPQPSSKENYLN